jgi:hypothetical protein
VKPIIHLLRDEASVKYYQGYAINLNTLAGLSDWNQTTKDLLEKEYLDLIGALSEGQPFQWWGSALSEKNALVSECFGRLYKLSWLDQCLRTVKGNEYIIVTDDLPLLKQIHENYSQKYVLHCHGRHLQRYHLKNFLRFLLGYLKQVYFLFKQAIIWVATQIYFAGVKKKFQSRSFDVALRSWFDHRSYKTGKLKDVFFPGLAERLQAKGERVCFFAGIRTHVIQSLSHFKKDNVNVVIPSFLFLRLGDIGKSFFYVLFRRVKIAQAVRFRNMPVYYILREEVSQDLFSLGFFAALLEHFCSLRFFSSVTVKRMIQIYENYAWEKMSILGARRADTHLTIYGFQHAFVSRNTFRYFPGEPEAERVPLPDRIVTMGKRTLEILKRFGAYSHTTLKAGVALRQLYLHTVKPLPPNPDGDIFVPLTITVKDTVRVIHFLYQAGLARYPRKVFLRFHPATPRPKVFKNLSFDLPPNFVISEAATIYEEIQRCSVVLYTFTTVCMESVAMGRPVIYLDVNDPYDFDPLFQCAYLKRTASNPDDLIPSIKAFACLKQNVYQQERGKALQYLRGYFYPLNEENLKSFYH